MARRVSQEIQKKRVRIQIGSQKIIKKLKGWINS